jgi:site-specific DNA recombinase
MCRGRLAGYRTDPEKPRDPAGLRIDEYEAAIVGQMFAWYLQRGATLGRASQEGSSKAAFPLLPVRAIWA